MLFTSVFQLKKLVVAIMSMVHSIVLFICNKKNYIYVICFCISIKKARSSYYVYGAFNSAPGKCALGVNVLVVGSTSTIRTFTKYGLIWRPINSQKKTTEICNKCFNLFLLMSFTYVLVHSIVAKSS
jgi:hypothetical protein